MAQVTDENDIASGRLRTVQLGDLSFRVPFSPTIAYMFWMRRFIKNFGEGNLTDDDIVDCYDQTVQFLRRYNKDVDEGALQESCELTDLIGFYNRCFAASEDEATSEARPTTRGGAARSTRRPSKSTS